MYLVSGSGFAGRDGLPGLSLVGRGGGEGADDGADGRHGCGVAGGRRVSGRCIGNFFGLGFGRG